MLSNFALFRYVVDGVQVKTEGEGNLVILVGVFMPLYANIEL